MLNEIHFSLKALRRTDAPLMSRVAYRAALKVECDRTGLKFDYTKKKGMMNPDQAVYLPGGRTEGRIEFWTRADAHIKKADAIVAREAVIALPHVLNDDQRQQLIEKFALAVVDKYSIAVDVCLHAPHRVTDYMLEKNPDQFVISDPFRDGERNNGNYHAHLMLSTSRVDPTTGELGKNQRELDPVHCKRNKIGNTADWARPLWARLVNEALSEAGIDHHVEHRSFQERGIDQTPTEHAGPAATNRQREGKDSYKLEAIRERAIAAAEEKIKLAEQYATLQTEIERTQQQLSHLQSLLEKQQQDPAEILENWSPRKKIFDAVERLEKRKQRQEAWFDYTKYSVTENLSIVSILVHKILVWLGLGGMPDVVNEMLKLADIQDKIENTQQQYQRKAAQLDKMQATALEGIKKNQQKARFALQIKLNKTAAMSEQGISALNEIGECMNTTEQLLASLQQSISEIAKAPMTPATVQQIEEKADEKPRKRKIVENEDDESGKTGKSGKAGGMSGMPTGAIKQRISHLRSLRPDLLFKAQLRAQGPFNLQEEREAQVQSLSLLSTEVEGLQNRLAELTETSTLIGKLLRPIFDRTEEKQVSEQLSQRRSELAAAKAELVKIETEYKRAWNQFQAQHGARWTQELKPELDALVKQLPIAEAREASEQNAQAQRQTLQEQMKRDAYLRQQRNARSVTSKNQAVDDHLAAEAARTRTAPAPKSYPRPKY